METNDNTETGDKLKTNDITKTIDSLLLDRMIVQNKKNINKHQHHWSMLTFRRKEETEEFRRHGPIVVVRLGGKFVGPITFCSPQH